MGFKERFNKLIGRGPKRIDKIKVMSTKKLPIPGFGGDEFSIQFKAKRDNKTKKWEITSYDNCGIAIKGIGICEKISNITKSAIAESDETTSTRGKNGSYLLDLDSMFTCLDVLEKVIGEYDGTDASQINDIEDPKDYFKNTMKRMPDNMQKTLLSQTAKITNIVKAEMNGNTTTAARPAPARKAQKPIN